MIDNVDTLAINQIGWSGDGLFIARGVEHEAPLWYNLGFEWDFTKAMWFTRSLLTVNHFPEEARTDACNAAISQQIQEGFSWRDKYSDARSSEAEFPLPAGVVARPYQKAGAEAIVSTSNLLLADDCGLGKTIQAIMAINRMFDVKRVLVVCPPHLVINWSKEWEKFGVRDDLPFYDAEDCLKKSKYKSAKRREPLPHGPGIYVVSHSVLWREKMHWLTPMSYDLVVVDEAQDIKTPGAKRTEKVAQVLASAQRRLLLTATPVLNRPVEVFHLVKHLGWADDFRTFARRYCEGHDGPDGFDASGASNLEELNNRLRSGFMVRRAIEDVIKDLPKVSRHLVVLKQTGYTKEIKAEWDALRKSKESKATVDDAIEALERYEPEGDGGRGELAVARREMAEAKAADVVAFVAPLITPKDPVVVFGHHTTAIRSIEAGLKKQGFRVGVIVGGMSKVAKNTIVEDFQAGLLDVLIGNMRAAGSGITLTRSRLEVYAEQDYTPGIMDQCDGRVIRLTAKRPISIYTLVVDGSVDAMVARTLQRKQKNIDKILA